MGSTAIQLAVASGAEVVTTASPANAGYCEELGAAAVFDYHDEGVEDAVVSWLAARKRTLAGAFHAVGADGAVQACARIVDRASGKAIVISVKPVPEEGIPKSVRVKRSESLSHFPLSWGWTVCPMEFQTDRGKSWRVVDLRGRNWGTHMEGFPARGA